MDCYYAAVEMRDNPEYIGKPLAVGGPSGARGVISTCNYEARKYGIHSAMATTYAQKLCPNLILVCGRMDVYREISYNIRSIMMTITKDIEPISLDEAYLDVTDVKLFNGSATLIAEHIRQKIFEATGLTASAGVAPVKFLAKIASDINKPDGIFVLTPKDIPDFVKKMPLKKIPGVGRVTQKKLLELGLITGLDVQNYPKWELIRHFGKFGQVIHDRSYGIDTNLVQSKRAVHSIGVETTLAVDIDDLEQGKLVLNKLINKLDIRVKDKDRAIAKQVVKLKFSDFTQTTIEQKSDKITNSLFFDLLDKVWERRGQKGVRLIGVAVGLPTSKNELLDSSMQLELSFEPF